MAGGIKLVTHIRSGIRQSHDVHTPGNVVLLNESKGYVGALLGLADPFFVFYGV